MDASVLVKQNEIIISLLGRIAFPNDKLKENIQRGSKKPMEILEAYNLCDGNTTITEIAKRAKIAQGSLSEAVDKWASLGIAFKLKSGNETLPLKLYTVV